MSEGMTDPMAPLAARARAPWLFLLGVGILATIWLSWRLDVRYLWQDEAMTAILGERMMKFGVPKGYDGVNIVSMDTVSDADESAFAEQATAPEKTLTHLVARKDFKADTTWTGHPWAQFLLAGISIELLGKSTWAARMPFVLCGVLTVIVLAEWLERLFKNRLLTVLAVLLLLGNVFWFMHTRQCRYYALTSLFTLTTFRFYVAWMQGNRLSAFIFVLSAWLLFQSDFGTFWPVIGALFFHAVIDRAKPFPVLLGVFSLLGASVLPFVFFYEIFDRLRIAFVSLTLRAFGEIHLVNQYIAPLALLAIVAWLAFSPKIQLSDADRLFAEPILYFLGLLLLWLTFVVPFPFFRYVVGFVPLAAGLLAWFLFKMANLLHFNARRTNLFASVATLLLIVSPILSSPVSEILPHKMEPPIGIGLFVRPELKLLAAEIFGTDIPDPNRRTVEFLQSRLKPGEEVAINYEDFPLIFYLDHPIRGGMMAFRLGDFRTPPPRFIIARPSVQMRDFQKEVFNRFLGRCRLKLLHADIPDFPWGHAPDPFIHYLNVGRSEERAMVYECLGWK